MIAQVTCETRGESNGCGRDLRLVKGRQHMVVLQVGEGQELQTRRQKQTNYHELGSQGTFAFQGQETSCFYFKRRKRDKTR